jgi:16S rRNA (guanine966-N2)-methyltransferase
MRVWVESDGDALRIIAGEFRSRKLESPGRGATTRPIPDRVKESLFNLLRGHVEGAAVMDLFAGTGSFGLEAISRGAARCLFFERDRGMARLLERNIVTLKAQDRAEVITSDALGPAALSRCPRPVDLVFIDPPYDMVRDPKGWLRVRTQIERLAPNLSDDGYLMLRTPSPFVHRKDRPPEAPGEERHVTITLDSVDELEDESIDEQFDKLFGAGEARADLVDVDLAVPGTEGPETRDYGTTAVHLYIREREE